MPNLFKTSNKNGHWILSKAFCCESENAENDVTSTLLFCFLEKHQDSH